MQTPDPKITTFLKKHHVLTLATVSGGQPWVANCFYAFVEEQMAFVFTSGYETRHIQEVTKNNKVAGNVVLETSIIGKIQGIQFSGTLTKAEGEVLDKASSAYLKRFPFAALMDTTLWILTIDYLKMTDNRLGFGKKLIWERM
ncbi:MAG: pyridoxamine 5'-phosphate oxidase family protein [Prolixibacteraceae bacterium]|nr:pyridoxamine 5'-phosphate oxidase family protein [Prolixibacteraceae bacterium]